MPTGLNLIHQGQDGLDYIAKKALLVPIAHHSNVNLPINIFPLF